MKKNQSKKFQQSDLPDSADDKKHLQPDEAMLDLPDVADIPGQEHVRPLPAGEMADTTISSAGEEGERLFDDEEELNGGSTNVTPVEKELLRRSSESMASEEDEGLRAAGVDAVDDEGAPLNENVKYSGNDLDIPGAEADDADEAIGEEDEENNSFSFPDQGGR